MPLYAVTDNETGRQFEIDSPDPLSPAQIESLVASTKRSRPPATVRSEYGNTGVPDAVLNDPVKGSREANDRTIALADAVDTVVRGVPAAVKTLARFTAGRLPFMESLFPFPPGTEHNAAKYYQHQLYGGGYNPQKELVPGREKLLLTPDEMTALQQPGAQLPTQQAVRAGVGDSLLSALLGLTTEENALSLAAGTGAGPLFAGKLLGDVGLRPIAQAIVPQTFGEPEPSIMDRLLALPSQDALTASKTVTDAALTPAMGALMAKASAQALPQTVPSLGRGILPEDFGDTMKRYQGELNAETAAKQRELNNLAKEREAVAQREAAEKKAKELEKMSPKEKEAYALQLMVDEAVAKNQKLQRDAITAALNIQQSPQLQATRPPRIQHTAEAAARAFMELLGEQEVAALKTQRKPAEVSPEWLPETPSGKSAAETVDVLRQGPLWQPSPEAGKSAAESAAFLDFISRLKGLPDVADATLETLPSYTKKAEPLEEQLTRGIFPVDRFRENVVPSEKATLPVENVKKTKQPLRSATDITAKPGRALYSDPLMLEVWRTSARVAMRDGKRFVDWAAPLLKQHGPEMETALREVWNQTQGRVNDESQKQSTFRPFQNPSLKKQGFFESTDPSVNLSARDAGDVIELVRLDTEPQGKGKGTEVLKQLKQLGKPIEVIARADTPELQQRLEAFYQRNGFRRTADNAFRWDPADKASLSWKQLNAKAPEEAGRLVELGKRVKELAPNKWESEMLRVLGPNVEALLPDIRSEMEKVQKLPIFTRQAVRLLNNPKLLGFTNERVDGTQLLNRLKTKLQPTEWKELENARIVQRFGGEEVAIKDVARFVSDFDAAAPYFTQEFTLRNKADELRQRRNAIIHQLETIYGLGPYVGHNDAEIVFAEGTSKPRAKDKALLDELATIKQLDLLQFNQPRRQAGYPAITTIGSRLAKSANYKETTVNLSGLNETVHQPFDKDTVAFWRTWDLSRENEKLSPSTTAAVKKGEKIRVVDEVQTDLNEKKHPELVREANRLAVKGLVDQALRDGQTHVLLVDADTAMQTEGHVGFKLLRKHDDDLPASVRVKGAKYYALDASEDFYLEVTPNSYDVLKKTYDGYTRDFKVTSELRELDTALQQQPYLLEKLRDAKTESVTVVPQRGGMMHNYEPYYYIVSKNGELLSDAKFKTAEAATTYALSRHGLGLKEGSKYPKDWTGPRDEADFKVVRGDLHSLMEDATGNKGEKIWFDVPDIDGRRRVTGFKYKLPDYVPSPEPYGKPTRFDALIERLEALRKNQDFSRLSSTPIDMIVRSAFNTALDAAIGSLKAGKVIHAAVSDAWDSVKDYKLSPGQQRQLKELFTQHIESLTEKDKPLNKKEKAALPTQGVLPGGTSLATAHLDSQLQEYGIPARVRDLEEAWPSTWKEAEAIIAGDKDAPQKVMQKAEGKRTALNSVDLALLHYKLLEQVAKHQNAIRQLGKAKEKTQQWLDAVKAEATAADELSRVHNVVADVRSELGRSLRFVNNIAEQYLSVDNMVRLKEAVTKKRVTANDLARFRDMEARWRQAYAQSLDSGDDTLAGIQVRAKTLGKAVSVLEDLLTKSQRQHKGKDASLFSFPASLPQQARLAYEGLLQAAIATLKAGQPVEVALRTLFKDMRKGGFTDEQLAQAREHITKSLQRQNVVKVKPRQLTPAQLKAKMELELIKQEFDVELHNDRMRNMTKSEKVKRNALMLMELERMAHTMLDGSAMGMQGLFLSIAHPMLALTKALPTSLKSVPSHKRALVEEIKMKTDPDFETLKKAGLDLSATESLIEGRQEEIFMGRLVRHPAKAFPVLQRLPAPVNAALRIPGGALRASGRAYAGYLNALRFHTAKQLMKTLEGEGIWGQLLGDSSKAPTPEQLHAVVNLVNTASGRMGLGKLAAAFETLGRVFYAPRFKLSTIAMLTGEPLFHGKGARTIIAAEYMKALSAIVMVSILANMAGMKVLPEKASDNDTVVRRMWRALLRGMLGTVTTPDGKQISISGAAPTTSKYLAQTGASIVSGLAKATSDKSFYDAEADPDVQDFLKTQMNFLRGNLAPFPAELVNFATGRNFAGDRMTWEEYFNNYVPLGWKDTVSDWNKLLKGEYKGEYNPAKGAAYLASDLLGFNTKAQRSQQYGFDPVALRETELRDNARQWMSQKGMPLPKIERSSDYSVLMRLLTLPTLEKAKEEYLTLLKTKHPALVGDYVANMVKKPFTRTETERAWFQHLNATQQQEVRDIVNRRKETAQRFQELLQDPEVRQAAKAAAQKHAELLRTLQVER